MKIRQKIRDSLICAQAEQGWNDESTVEVLRGFIEQLAENDRVISEQFQDYLDERIQEENGELEDYEEEMPDYDE